MTAPTAMQTAVAAKRMRENSRTPRHVQVVTQRIVAALSRIGNRHVPPHHSDKYTPFSAGRSDVDRRCKPARDGCETAVLLPKVEKEKKKGNDGEC